MQGSNLAHINGMDWRQSIMNQLHARKSIEQTPFEDICSFACDMFDKVDIYKSENIQLNLQREQLQQEILFIQQTLLVGGSAAAKTVLSKLSTRQDSENSETSGSSATAKNLNLQHASILAEKAQLEKKILEIQEKLADVLNSKSDLAEKIADLRIELDEKERINRDLTSDIDKKDREIVKLKEALNIFDNKHQTLIDEHLALTLSNKSLEKKHYQLSVDFDLLKQQLIALKSDDADRLNAENERIQTMQQERMKKELELNAARMPHIPGDGSNFEECGEENFEHLGVSRIPSAVEFSFEPRDGELFAINWFSCSGPRDSYLATGGSDRNVMLWKINDGRNDLAATLLGSNASITSIDVETDVILASSNDFSARIWNSSTHKLMQTLTGHSSRVSSAKFLGNPYMIGTGSSDRTIKIWNINRKQCTKTYFAGRTCSDLVYHNNRVISGHQDCNIRFWDLLMTDNNEPSGVITLQAKITSLDISKDGTKLLCSLRDDTIKCIDLRKMEVVQTYSGEKFRIGTDFVRAKFSIDGQLVSCGSSDGSLYIWDTNSAKVEKILTNHSTTLIASCWSPDGKRLATIDKGKRVTIWL